MIDGFLIARLFGDWLFGISTLISLINPLGIAFVFHANTRALAVPERRQLAAAVGRNAFLVLLVSMVVGARILNFFGISLDALRIAGGLVVAKAGWDMLSADDTDAPRSAPVNAASAAGQAFFPLTMPLTTGPGSVAAAIALTARRPDDDLLVAVLAALLIAGTVAVLIWLAYRNADALARRLGSQGTLVATKVSAFLLLCVGVQIVLTGVSDALQRLFPGH